MPQHPPLGFTELDIEQITGDTTSAVSSSSSLSARELGVLYEQGYPTSPTPTIVSSEVARRIEDMSAGSVLEFPDFQTVFVDPRPTQPTQPPEFIWTTQDGNQIPISRIEDGHLLNIIKMLSKNMIGISKSSGAYQNNEHTLELMRAERDKRNAQQS